MNTPAQIGYLQQMVSHGAWLYIYKTGDRIALGAAAWIENRGLLVAELGAQHQGQAHLIAGEQLEADGPSLDLLGARGDIVATIDPMTPDEYKHIGVAPRQELVTASGPDGDAWRAFWQAEISNAKEN